jgi:hypothetical protein
LDAPAGAGGAPTATSTVAPIAVASASDVATTSNDFFNAMSAS